jgi:diadenosine tetraphosphate (Ap4A) HIT family hydrolase
MKSVVNSAIECVLCCDFADEIVLVKQPLYRIIWVRDDPGYVGYLRLILNQHVKEMTDLDDDTANLLLRVMLRLERYIRHYLSPDKINLASLGNQVPHLHWHIIPRYFGDKHYPNPIWGAVTHPNYTPRLELLSLENELIEVIKLEFN